MDLHLSGAEPTEATQDAKEHKGRAFQSLGSTADAPGAGPPAKSAENPSIKLVLGRGEAEELEHGAINEFMRLEMIIHAR